MAAVSYWLLSPSFLLAIAGKVRGWDRTTPTPVRDWRTAKVDVVIPARNEERQIALALDSLIRQDFPVRNIIVIDDASTDRTSEVVDRFAALSGHDIVLVRRNKPGGKTPGIREICQSSDADVLFVLDADTVLMHDHYISRTVEEMYRNASVASVCGEVMPLREKTVAAAAQSEILQQLTREFGSVVSGTRSRGLQMLINFTVIYRTAIYLFLHRLLYDGHLKLTGGTLNPAGCAVAYRRDRLAECFAYAGPKVGDNLSVSEDIYIGHFFNWKGYRNIHVGGIQCESGEPPITHLSRQLFLWSSSFLQSIHYFPALPMTIFKWPGMVLRRHKQQQPTDRRHMKEQYRAPWGEQYTRRCGRTVGLIDLTSLVEKISLPIILIGLAITNPRVAVLTLFLEMLISATAVALVSDSGSRMRGAVQMLAATPFRLLSIAVDMFAIGSFAVDLATGNRSWRK